MQQGLSEEPSHRMTITRRVTMDRFEDVYIDVRQYSSGISVIWRRFRCLHLALAGTVKLSYDGTTKIW